MTRLILRLAALGSDRRAVTALEYAIIAGVLVVGVFAGVQFYGNALEEKFVPIAASLT